MKPFFLPSNAGKIFCIYYAPPSTMSLRGHILFIPPFAEELNRSRHMIARQARLLAAHGYGVLVPDLYGTGDSEGTYAQTNWDIWSADLISAFAWLQDRGASNICFWAMRSGALLLPPVLSALPSPPQNLRLLLWAPVLRGENFLVQFLRIKAAASLTQGNGTEKITTKELQRLLDDGQTLEIGGYDLTPTMAGTLKNAALQDLPLRPQNHIVWLDLGGEASDQLPPAAEKQRAAWSQTPATTVIGKIIEDAPFWTLQEPEWANNLLQETLNQVKGMFDDAK